MLPENRNDAYDLEQIFGSYPFFRDSRVLMGGCNFTIRFDTSGEYRRPEQVEGLQAFEAVSVGRQKTLCCFLDVMNILFDDPWVSPVSLDLWPRYPVVIDLPLAAACTTIMACIVKSVEFSQLRTPNP